MGESKRDTKGILIHHLPSIVVMYFWFNDFVRLVEDPPEAHECVTTKADKTQYTGLWPSLNHSSWKLDMLKKQVTCLSGPPGGYKARGMCQSCTAHSGVVT